MLQFNNSDNILLYNEKSLKSDTNYSSIQGRNNYIFSLVKIRFFIITDYFLDKAWLHQLLFY